MLDNKKYKYIYIIWNNINSHFYIGKHITDNLDDGYMGSGLSLKSSIKKYGIENFNKEIIEYCDSLEELNEKEKFYIAFHIGNKYCYNISLGGDGGDLYNCLSDERKKISNKRKSEAKKKYWGKLSEEQKNNKLYKSHEGLKNYRNSLDKDVVIQKMSKISKKFWESMSQSEKNEFCKRRGVSLKGYKYTEEQKVIFSLCKQGKIAINNGNKHIMINPEEFNIYKDKGWVKGSLSNRSGDRNPMYGKKGKNNPNFGKKRNKLSPMIGKLVSKEEFENHFKNLGWVRGKLRKQ